MMIPSMFPHLFDFSLLGIAVLRVALGLTLIALAYTKFFRDRRFHISLFETHGVRRARAILTAIVVIEALAGIAVILGLYLQIAVLVTGALALISAGIAKYKPSLSPKYRAGFYLLLAVISFSLLLMGPGVLAFDMYL